MERSVSARLTTSAGRKFGFTVGIAFVAIGLMLAWRAHSTKAIVAGSFGGVLILAGLFVPTRLGPVERAWMGLALLISKVTTPIFMGVVYFFVITPIGFFRNRKGDSPINRVRGISSWHPHQANAKDGQQMERQF